MPPSAARAVLQTGEFDFAWNLQVEDDVLKRMENGGKGRVIVSPGGALEFVELAWHDPSERSRASAAARNRVIRSGAMPALRQAMTLLLDRQAVQDFVYGRAGIATGSVINNPARFRSPNTKFEFNVDKANACSTPPAGSAAATASARRTGASSASSSRPRSTAPGRRRSRSSSRPARRPAWTSS
jgi:peptide/nickel transport system substrate-binding protein